MVWTWWIRSPVTSMLLWSTQVWDLTHPLWWNLDLTVLAVTLIPQLWCVVQMLAAAVARPPILKYFCISFWKLQLPSVTNTMHCFLQCSYVSLGCQQVGRWVLMDWIWILAAIAAGHIDALSASFLLFKCNFEHAGSVSQIMTFQLSFTTKTYLPTECNVRRPFTASDYISKIWDYHKKWGAILH